MASIIISAKRPWLSLFPAVALALLVAGCPPNGTTAVPAPQFDHAPIITVINGVLGDGTANPTSETTSTTVVVSSGATFFVAANAANPGGVKDFSLSLTPSGGPTTSVNVPFQAQVVDQAGSLPTIIYISGTDGQGHTGSQLFKFTMSGMPVTLTATAVNFNNMSTTINVTYECLGCTRSIGPPGTSSSSSPCPNACPAGAICCNGACAAESVTNCGTCGHACAAGQTCSSGQCTTPAPTCQAAGATCVPADQTGLHCCANELCNFQICVACFAHGQVCPTGGKQICCSASDQCVLDPGSNQVVCAVPDCSGDECPSVKKRLKK